MPFVFLFFTVGFDADHTLLSASCEKRIFIGECDRFIALLFSNGLNTIVQYNLFIIKGKLTNKQMEVPNCNQVVGNRYSYCLVTDLWAKATLPYFVYNFAIR